ncbi:MAG: hypothetical protein KatS3mg031_1320 [Chitinophagales bacterium]|nr:MAG: hypothetical protein KatS3mg031_1320 [Chitinophagales bacterium]
MNGSTVSLVGRVMFCLPLVLFGFNHFANAQMMAPMVPIPGGVIWVYFTGAALLAAAVSIILNKMTKLSGLLLGIMLIAFALGVHLKGMLEATDEMAKMTFFTGMIKDLGLAGAAFYISGKNWES